MNQQGAVRDDYHALVRREVELLVPPGSGRLLDLGGGVGATAAWLKSEGQAAQVEVIDLVEPAAPHPGVDFFRSGNLETTDVLDRTLAEEGPFDTILCLDVLEHLADPWAVIAKLHRGLAPGGVIVASIPNIRYYQASFPLFFRGTWTLADSGPLDRTHLRWFVKETAEALMTSSGLVHEVTVEKRGGGRRDRVFDLATLGLLRGFWVMQYLIRVRRPAG